MIDLKPTALYSRSDLAAMLDGSGVDVDFFIRRLNARKVFKCLWSGRDLLAAYDDAKPLAESFPTTTHLSAYASSATTQRTGIWKYSEQCDPVIHLLGEAPCFRDNQPIDVEKWL